MCQNRPASVPPPALHVSHVSHVSSIKRERLTIKMEGRPLPAMSELGTREISDRLEETLRAGVAFADNDRCSRPGCYPAGQAW